MKNLIFSLLCSALLIPLSSHALSSTAEEGKRHFAVCNACHNPALEPPLAPPMWSVKRIYKRNTIDDDDFIQTITAFVKAPSIESALHQRAVNRIGLMQAMPLPDELLQKLATYILEEDFPPPCIHWENGIKSAKKAGNVDQAMREQHQFNRHCQ